ncbi:MAG TPA: transcriptional repressor [Dehalococcoidia bacterium]|nr:transcriptional repressor [Dehalococcoidia bacterium]
MRGAEELLNLFRSRGLRITPQRQEIFRVLAGNDTHPTAEAVWAEARKAQPSISLKTVYETLHELVSIGEIQRVNLEAGASRFDPNVSAHHHLICRTCGRMVDVACLADDTPCLRAPYDSGYEIEEAEIVYWGRCPECAATSPVRQDQDEPEAVPVPAAPPLSKRKHSQTRQRGQRNTERGEDGNV